MPDHAADAALFDALLLLGMFAVVGATALYDRLTDDDSDGPDDPMEIVEQRYLDGEIDDETFEARLDVLADPGRHRVYEHVDAVDWAGHDEALRVAREYASLDELRDADRESLEDVHGVGESIATAILRDLGA